MLKATLSIPVAGTAGQHGAVGLAATISVPDVLGLTGARITVAAGPARPLPALHSPRPASPASTSTPPVTRAAPPQAALADPGAAAGAASVVGAPSSVLGAPPQQIAGLTFPTVTPGAHQTASGTARPGFLDGSMATVSDRLPLSTRQLELQSGELGLLAIALVITIARVSVRGHVQRRGRPARLPRLLPGHRTGPDVRQGVTGDAASPSPRS